MPEELENAKKRLTAELSNAFFLSIVILLN